MNKENIYMNIFPYPIPYSKLKERNVYPLGTELQKKIKAITVNKS